MRALSATLAAGHLLFVPAFLLFPVTQVVPGRVSIVASLNPAWPWLFLVSGLWLLAAALLVDSQLLYGHGAAAAAFGAMGFASLAGSLVLPWLGYGDFGNPSLGISGVLLAIVHGTLAVWSVRRHRP